MNAKKEFLEHVGDNKVTKAVLYSSDYKTNEIFMLKSRHTKKEWNAFLSKLNFDYDENSYGGQFLYGFIWYADKTWSIRGEYDGSEWWNHITKPDFKECLKQAKEN